MNAVKLSADAYSSQTICFSYRQAPAEQPESTVPSAAYGGANAYPKRSRPKAMNEGFPAGRLSFHFANHLSHHVTIDKDAISLCPYGVMLYNCFDLQFSEAI